MCEKCDNGDPNKEAERLFGHAYFEQQSIVSRRNLRKMMENLDDPQVAERNREFVRKMMEKKPKHENTTPIGELELPTEE